MLISHVLLIYTVMASHSHPLYVEDCCNSHTEAVTSLDDKLNSLMEKKFLSEREARPKGEPIPMISTVKWLMSEMSQR
ncbi:MAG: hypothetical protein D6723_11905 [Acidobacteria bacterium]|nr:MAG: hypothetical protein D6723_11905 [Acidobacteriota bacterium]